MSITGALKSLDFECIYAWCFVLISIMATTYKLIKFVQELKKMTVTMFLLLATLTVESFISLQINHNCCAFYLERNVISAR
jgi:hypothetical protein